MNAPEKTQRAGKIQTPGEVAPIVDVEQLDGAPEVVKVVKLAKPVREKHDYRDTPASEIDPATLTAPVLSRDGYVCPVPVEVKK